MLQRSLSPGDSIVHHPKGADDVIEGPVRCRQCFRITLAELDIGIVFSRFGYHACRKIDALNRSTFAGHCCREMARSATDVQYLFSNQRPQGFEYGSDDLIGDGGQMLIVACGAS